MAIQTITYDDKVALNENSSVAEINKVTDNNMNEIKSVVNNNATETSTNTTNITNLQTYSTSEVNTGKTWIDGKPIYRKVINCGSLPNATSKTINHNIQNIEHSYIYGTAIRSSDKREFPLPYAAASAGSEIQLDLTNTAIQITTSVDRSAFDQTYVIIEYTKTTD